MNKNPLDNILPKPWLDPVISDPDSSLPQSDRVLVDPLIGDALVDTMFLMTEVFWDIIYVS
jgi:hypothetical protein